MLKIILRIIAGLTAAAFVYFSYNYNLRFVFEELYPYVIQWWIAVFFLLLAGWRCAGRLFGALNKISDRSFAIFIFAFILTTTGAIARLCYDGIPHVQDEINYLFQARLFADFKIYQNSHPLAEFFHFSFMVNDGKWYTLFQPMWPAAMVPFVWIGAAWLAAPFYAALTGVLAYYAFKDALNKNAAQAAVLLLALSPFFAFMAGGMMAHTFALFATVLMLFAAVRAVRRKSARYLAVCAAAFGALANTRAATAIGVGAPVMAYVLAGIIGGFFSGKINKARHARFALKGFAALAIAGVPFAALMFYYNYTLTGSLTDFPQERYFRLTEDNQYCHRLGLGKNIGCRFEHGPDIHWKEFTPKIAEAVTHERLNQYKGNFYGYSILMAALMPALALGGAQQALNFLMLLGLVAVYFFYYYHGICYGARYYFESAASFIFLVVSGCYYLIELGRKYFPLRPLAVLLPSVILVMVGMSFPKMDYPIWKERDNGFWAVNENCKNAAARGKLTNALVFVPGDKPKDFRICFVSTDHNIEKNVIFARDLGRHNENLARFYPDRKIYRFIPSEKGDMVEYTVEKFAPSVYLEGEAKFPAPYMGSGWNEIQDMNQFKGSGASGGRQLFYHGKEVGDFFGFEHFIFEDGIYRLRPRLTEANDYAIIDVFVDGATACSNIDLYAERDVKTTEKICEQEISLKRGSHKFVFIVKGKNAASRGYMVGLDAMKIEYLRPGQEGAR